MSKHLQLLLCAAVLTFGFAATASAQEDIYRTQLHGGLWLGFGGEFDAGEVAEGDAATLVGGQVGVDYRLSSVFSLGLEGRMGSYGVDGLDDRSRFYDIDAKPRLIIPLGEALELYGAVPVGLTISQVGGDIDSDVGWNIGAAAGLTLFLTDTFGLNAEPSWMMHRFGVSGPDNDATAELQQFSLMLNAVIRL